MPCVCGTWSATASPRWLDGELGNVVVASAIEEGGPEAGSEGDGMTHHRHSTAERADDREAPARVTVDGNDREVQVINATMTAITEDVSRRAAGQTTRGDVEAVVVVAASLGATIVTVSTTGIVTTTEDEHARGEAAATVIGRRGDAISPPFFLDPTKMGRKQRARRLTTVARATASSAIYLQLLSTRNVFRALAGVAVKEKGKRFLVLVSLPLRFMVRSMCCHPSRPRLQSNPSERGAEAD